MKELDNEFDLYWGLCPPGTPKYRARERAKAFYNSKIKEIRDEIVGEVRKRSEDDPESFCIADVSLNQKRQEDIEAFKKYGF